MYNYIMHLFILICNSTVFALMYNKSKLTYLYTRHHRDSNRRPLNWEATILPLRYHCSVILGNINLYSFLYNFKY